MGQTRNVRTDGRMDNAFDVTNHGRDCRETSYVIIQQESARHNMTRITQHFITNYCYGLSDFITDK